MSVLSSYYSRWLMRKAKKAGLQIGENSIVFNPQYLGTEPYLISIGDNVRVTSGVRFITHDGGTWVVRRLDRYKDVVKYGRITIGDNCMIGNNSILLPGVTIGRNCLVAAGSVVTNDIAPNSVVRGNPARRVCGIEDYAEMCLESMPPIDRKRYREDKVSELLRVFPRPW